MILCPIPVLGPVCSSKMVACIKIMDSCEKVAHIWVIVISLVSIQKIYFQPRSWVNIADHLLFFVR